MAFEYYDDAVIAKLVSWMPENSTLRVLAPEETKELFKVNADDSGDSPFTLPCIALSRNTDIEILQNINNARSLDGMRIERNRDDSLLLNMIPVKVQYQLDIFAKQKNQAEEYVREYLFKLINNPEIRIEVPYNNRPFEHVAYIRVQDTISDTSNISERVFPGQFTRWTFNLEIQDAMLFSIKYRRNWKMMTDDGDMVNLGELRVVENLGCKEADLIESIDTTE